MNLVTEFCLLKLFQVLGKKLINNHNTTGNAVQGSFNYTFTRTKVEIRYPSDLFERDPGLKPDTSDNRNRPDNSGKLIKPDISRTSTLDPRNFAYLNDRLIL